MDDTTLLTVAVTIPGLEGAMSYLRVAAIAALSVTLYNPVLTMAAEPVGEAVLIKTEVDTGWNDRSPRNSVRCQCRAGRDDCRRFVERLGPVMRTRWLPGVEKTLRLRGSQTQWRNDRCSPGRPKHSQNTRQYASIAVPFREPGALREIGIGWHWLQLREDCSGPAWPQLRSRSSPSQSSSG
jgi:hypothetical protein